VRKRWLSLLVTLTFLLSIVLPAGSAFAADPVSFSNGVQKGIDDDDDTPLGWIKIDVDEDTVAKDTYFFVSISLPDGVDYEAVPTSGDIGDGKEIYFFAKDTTDQYVYSEVATGQELAIIGTPDEDSVTFLVYETFSGIDYMMFRFNTDGKSYVWVESGYDGDIAPEVEVRATQGGYEVSWSPKTANPVIGQTGDKEITVTADTPKAVSEGTDKELAKITLSENLPGAFDVNDIVYLELVNDDDFDLTDVVVKDGSYGLTASATAISTDEWKVTITGESSLFGDELELTPYVTVYPGASGDIEIEVTCPENDDFDEDTVKVGTVGDVDVTVTGKGTPDDIYPATLNLEVKDLEFEAASNFTSGDDFTLTLPEGFEWHSYSVPTGLDDLGTFNDDRSMWLKIGTLNDDEFTLDNLKINAAADAPTGDVTVQITGDLGEHSVVVGTCNARATFEADKPEILAGNDRAAGDITITETEDDSLSNNKKLLLVLPADVEFADEPTVEVNGDEINGVDLIDDDQTLKITLSDLGSGRIDTIVISDIEYNVDSGFGLGDIELEVKGDAVNKLGTTEVNDTDEDDEVATVANATVVTATKRDSSFVIGATTYTVNGEEQTMDVAPYIKGDRTFMPVRYAALACGVDEANILWDGTNKTVTLIKGDRVAQMKIGSTTMLINGAAITMDVAPEIVYPGRTMLPVRWVGQALGAQVDWDAETQTVTLNVP